MKYLPALCQTIIATCWMTLGSTSPAAEPAPPSCEPDAGLQFLCGPKNVEDLVRIGDSRWLIGSGMDGASTGPGAVHGHLHLIDHQKKTWQVAFPDSSPTLRLDKRLYAGCPAPLNVNNFSAHGIALRELARGSYRLYVVSHGDRESVEVFEVDARGATPTFTWTGCVVLPDDVSANSVAILPDWGFVVTKFLDRTLPQAESMAQARQGKLNGAVFEWHPGGKVAAIPGTELSAPNGIEVSPDGKTLYVAVFGSHEFVRFRRNGNSLKKDAVPLAISADNVRWSANGKLLTAGGNYAGANAPRTTGWTVVEVDPETLTTRTAASGDRSNGMQAISVGLAVNGEIWVGTFGGDRVGYTRAR
ncbi:MAG TPA: hypothetical protein VN645_07985 [Steroidobacteraceae bacterium]|nr:hypothetical protein [Steroidobacteraceae bacterium]